MSILFFGGLLLTRMLLRRLRTKLMAPFLLGTHVGRAELEDASSVSLISGWKKKNLFLNPQ